MLERLLNHADITGAIMLALAALGVYAKRILDAYTKKLERSLDGDANSKGLTQKVDQNSEAIKEVKDDLRSTRNEVTATRQAVDLLTVTLTGDKTQGKPAE